MLEFMASPTSSPASTRASTRATARTLGACFAAFLARLRRPGWLRSSPHWGALALDPWLPRGCALCATPITQIHAGLCRHCRVGLPGRLRPRCARCGLARPETGECSACTLTDFAFDATCVLADYAAPLDRLIAALKFGGQLAGGHALGLELAIALRRWQLGAAGSTAGLITGLITGSTVGLPADTTVEPIALLVGVPLAPARLRERGYDQAGAIAAALSRRTGIAHGEALRRVRHTRPQSTLPMAARHSNLQDAFELAQGQRALPGHIALVDDVMTTGATLHAAAARLKRAGVRRITAIVVARTD